MKIHDANAPKDEIFYSEATCARLTGPNVPSNTQNKTQKMGRKRLK